MTENTASSSRYALLPIYLVIDTSGSMSGDRIQAVQNIIPRLIETCEDHPSINDKIQLGIITFDRGARVLVPLGGKDNLIQMPELDASGWETDFAAAFDLMRSEIESGVRIIKSSQAPDGSYYQCHRPAMFFLTDGGHNANSDYKETWKTLTDPGFAARPNIVPIGVADANGDVLEQLKFGNGMVAILAKPGTDAAEALTNVVEFLIRSIVKSGTGDTSTGIQLDFTGLSNDLEVLD